MSAEGTQTFKYDVAISLLDQDLAIAQEIKELLSDRLDVFLYSEQQLEIAATDGIDKFSEVFRREARVVVVLARELWGKTKWTRIEETALKSRGLEEGWDFLFVITLEGMKAVPIWVPVAQLWAELDRLGVRGAAAVIERKLGDRGADVRPETAEDVAARISRARAAEQARQGFLRSQSGMDAATASMAQLVELVQTRAGALSMRVDRDSAGRIVLTLEHLSVTLYWSRQYSNSLDGSSLTVRLWDGIVSDHVHRQYRAKNPTSELVLEFDLRSDVVGWTVEKNRDRFFTTEGLTDHCMKVLLQAAEGERVRL
jgi:hypothetical protein